MLVKSASRLVFASLFAVLFAVSVPSDSLASLPNTLQSAQSINARNNQLLYVADGSGPVAAYAAKSTGAVSPVLTISNPDPTNTYSYWNPWGVAFDRFGNLYVQSFLSDATSFVFAPGARGHAVPRRIFMGGGPDSRSIAVDSAGYEYVATSESSSEILVMAPGVSGKSNDLYHVAPLRTIFTDEAVWYPWPSLLAVDSRSDVLAAIVRSQGNAVEVFAGGRSRNNSPIRVIAGPKTQLGSCSSTCENFALTFSRYTGNIYVGVSSGARTRINMFAQNARENAAPIRTIEGANTGLQNSTITGIAVSECTGEIYAMVKGSQFGSPGKIVVFGRDARGNARPERSFVDFKTRFADANGIALTP